MTTARLDVSQECQWPIRAMTVSHVLRPSSGELCERQHKHDGQAVIASLGHRAPKRVTEAREVSCGDLLNRFDDDAAAVLLADERNGDGELLVKGGLVDVVAREVRGILVDDTKAKALGGTFGFLAGDECGDLGVHVNYSVVGEINIGPMDLERKRYFA